MTNELSRDDIANLISLIDTEFEWNQDWRKSYPLLKRIQKKLKAQIESAPQ